MKVFLALAVSTCVLASATSASAQAAITLDGGFALASVGPITLDDWNANGALSVPLDDDLDVQGNLSFAKLTGSDVGENAWNLGATATYWPAHTFRIGVTTDYENASANTLDHNSSSTHVFNYGGFAELFAGIFTLGAKGGGFTGNAGASGSYVGGEATTYLFRDFALTGTIDYAGFQGSNIGQGFNETDFTAEGEWLIWERAPITLFCGYTFAVFSGFDRPGNGDVMFVGVRLYANGSRARDLIDRQRTGTVGWAANFGPVGASL